MGSLACSIAAPTTLQCLWAVPARATVRALPRHCCQPVLACVAVVPIVGSTVLWLLCFVWLVRRMLLWWLLERHDEGTLAGASAASAARCSLYWAAWAAFATVR
eukprot:5771111-Alexandrium_andersonii.AAC.1